MPEYDLLVKNAHLIDPDQGLDAIGDLAIRDGRIARLSPDLPAAAARTVLEADQRMVSAGWIDLHAHPAEAVVSFGLPPDAIGVRQGVTAIADAGSTGYANFACLRRYVIPAAATDLFCFLHISPVGEVVLPEIGYEACDRVAFIHTVQAHRQIIKGIKMRVIAEVVHSAVDVIALARSLAQETGLPLMVHIGTASTPQATEEAIMRFTRRLLTLLRQDDIITHAFTPKAGAIFDHAGNPLPELSDALARGVRLDVGSAHAHFSFRAARAALQNGFAPYTLSTDLTTLTHGKADRLSLSLVMSEFMALGFSLSEVIRRVTGNPARALGESATRGSLREGMLADLTLFHVRAGDYTFSDGRAGHTQKGAALIVPEMVIKAGVIMPTDGIDPNWAPLTPHPG